MRSKNHTARSKTMPPARRTLRTRPTDRGGSLELAIRLSMASTSCAGPVLGGERQTVKTPFGITPPGCRLSRPARSQARPLPTFRAAPLTLSRAHGLDPLPALGRAFDGHNLSRRSGAAGIVRHPACWLMYLTMPKIAAAIPTAMLASDTVIPTSGPKASLQSAASEAAAIADAPSRAMQAIA